MIGVRRVVRLGDVNRHGFPISARIIIRTYYKLRSDLSEHVGEVSFRAGKGEEKEYRRISNML